MDCHDTKILVCGEALFDIFCSDHDGTLQWEARAAGSPFNVAVGLARLGHPVAFCAGLASGTLGQHLRSQLEREGVDCSLSQTFEAPTTLSLIETDAKGSPRYTFYGAGGADRLMSGEPDLASDIAAIQVGSYPLVIEPIAGMLRSLVKREWGRRLVACDVNVRPTVEPLLDRWRDAADWYSRHASLMKASEEDVALLWPGHDVQDLAQAWLDEGCELVVITQGADGVTAWNRHARVRVQGQPARVVDTVGAGDAFQAALLHRLSEVGFLRVGALRELDPSVLRDALTFATRAAALVCERRGADPARREDIESLSA